MKELLEASGMSQTEFSAYFGIPYRTVQDWHGERRKCPDYLLRLMVYRLEMDGKLRGHAQA